MNATRTAAAGLTTGWLIAVAAQAGAQPAKPERFGLGRPATEAEIAVLDIDVGPDGAGLPIGQGRAGDGAPVWAQACAVCHGAAGEGGTAGPVVGRGQDRPTVGSYWPYATTLWDYINRAMPRNRPGTLTAHEVYGLVAWILAANEIIGEADVMDAETLPAVLMPARDQFVPDDRRGGPEVR